MLEVGCWYCFFFFQAEDGIRDYDVTGVQTCALPISGGSDKTGTSMRGDLDGGARKAILVTESTGFKGHKLVYKNSKRYRYKPDGLRKRRYFRGNTITQDTRQINLKAVKHGNKSQIGRASCRDRV